ILLLISFLFYLFRKKIILKKITFEFWYLLIFPVGLFIIYLDYGYTIYQEYVLGLTVPIALAFSIICIKLWKQTTGKILVILFVMFTLFYTFTMIIVPYNQSGSAGSYLNQKHIVDWVLQDSKGKKVGYFVYTADTYTTGMDYL